jgi:hypothetical protein
MGLTGCAGIFKELRQDPAIVVSTGFYLSFGLNPAPEVGGFPLPNIKIGYGTISRIGGNRDVTVTVGTATDIKAGEEKASGIPTLGSRASLHITAKDSGYLTPEKVRKARKVRATKVKDAGVQEKINAAVEAKAKVKNEKPITPAPPPHMVLDPFK